MIRWWHWLVKLPENRGAVASLIFVNLAGALYGFNWYRDQLAASPWKLWPVIPDSPLAALFFGMFLLAVYLGRRLRWLEALAFLSMIKYGLWTVLVFLQYWLRHGVTNFEEVHLTLSHASMAMEAVIFLRYYYPGAVAGFSAWLWFVLNDYMDYFRGTHPNLPDPALLGGVSLSAFALTAVAITVYFVLGGRARRSAGVGSHYA